MGQILKLFAQSPQILYALSADLACPDALRQQTYRLLQPVMASMRARHEWTACWLQSKAQATKDDLMNRLSNACKQRDAAREEALLSSEKLAKLQEDIDSGALQPASAAPAPQPAAPPSPDGVLPPPLSFPVHPSLCLARYPSGSTWRSAQLLGLALSLLLSIPLLALSRSNKLQRKEIVPENYQAWRQAAAEV